MIKFKNLSYDQNHNLVQSETYVSQDELKM